MKLCITKGGYVYGPPLRWIPTPPQLGIHPGLGWGVGVWGGCGGQRQRHMFPLIMPNDIRAHFSFRDVQGSDALQLRVKLRARALLSVLSLLALLACLLIAFLALFSLLAVLYKHI